MPFDRDGRRTMRIHRLDCDGSEANGPGRRAVLWVQGCSRRCPQCANPTTHDKAGGWPETIDNVARAIVRSGLDLTISGGEPLEQLAELDRLRHFLRFRGFRGTTLLFTGWTWSEIQADDDARRTVDRFDAAIVGPYDYRRACNLPGLLSSSNQELVLISDRFQVDDFDRIPPAEIRVDVTGQISITGISSAPIARAL
jgi:anaerobic ribonucleoside-triphosphate reductase activating protein